MERIVDCFSAGVCFFHQQPVGRKRDRCFVVVFICHFRKLNECNSESKQKREAMERIL